MAMTCLETAFKVRAFGCKSLHLPDKTDKKVQASRFRKSPSTVSVVKEISISNVCVCVCVEECSYNLTSV